MKGLGATRIKRFRLPDFEADQEADSEAADEEKSEIIREPRCSVTRKP
jgi:hypothetical protein